MPPRSAFPRLALRALAAATLAVAALGGWIAYRAEAKNAGSTIGSGLEDGWIHFKVRGALALVDDLRDSTINVDVDNNVVTLRGSVANAAQKAKAEAEAKKIDGVKSVTNKLEIKPAGSNTNTAANANKKG